MWKWKLLLKSEKEKQKILSQTKQMLNKEGSNDYGVYILFPFNLCHFSIYTKQLTLTFIIMYVVVGCLNYSKVNGE